MDDVITRVSDFFGGGLLGPVMIVAGLVALLVAWKAAKLVLRMLALAATAVLLLGTVPWAGQDVAGPVAACAVSAVQNELSGWQETLTKRITVEELSPDATCTAPEDGLAGGSATVRLRTVFDLPFQSWEVDASGARSTSTRPVATAA